jgi:hypothetical protein
MFAVDPKRTQPTQLDYASMAQAGRSPGGDMERIWVTVVVLGLLASALAQLTAAALCFSLSPGKGLASLVVPGYLFVGIRQHQYYRLIVVLWIVGLVAITAGTIALT